MNLVEVFVEVGIPEACLGFSGYRIVALLILKALIATTASDNLICFSIFRRKYGLTFMQTVCLADDSHEMSFIFSITKSILECSCYKFA